MTKELDSIRLSSVEISPDRVSELDGKQTSKTIQKNEIVSISLEYGICSERTFLQVIFSIFMILIGFYLGLIPTGKFIYDIYSHTGVIMALFISVAGTRPIWGLILFVCGFLLFISAKVMNFRRGVWISFGSNSMQKGQRWIYRAGYILMILGFIGIIAAAAFTKMLSH